MILIYACPYMLSTGGKVVYAGANGQPCLDYFTASGLPGTDAVLHQGREAEWVVGVITGAGEAGSVGGFGMRMAYDM